MVTEPNRIEEVFSAALQRKAGPERTAYLHEVCRNDEAMRERIEALLAAGDAAGEFLRQPALGGDSVTDESTVTEGPGTVIGRYKLLERIGEGGMAVVYMAEQEQPIRRKVALKIIKLGMDTKQVIARFEAERQALALMDHPSIAKVLDGGATETGRPYFVMELVQGVSITEYCDKNNLSTKDRLALFVQVCTAVQHAHQKGIIHRDIKPSNVMVTHHDGKPVPKVIDFGIAKATNQRLTEKTLFTRYAHIIGTPAYMSPEQAELSDLDIDTRSDIYSLGVLLYELLTGTTPFREEELRKAGYIEMQRVIREQEPVKPSTRIRTSQVGQPPSAGKPEGSPPRAGVLHVWSPAFRRIRPRKRGTPNRAGVRCTPYQQVKGDLDWIVMKSLEKDRARRYETASGLAEDIRRHLEHEPVLARSPGATYRLRKFLRRHQAQVLATLAIVVVASAAVVVLSLWNRDRRQAHRGILSQAREQYARADRESALETVKPILHSRHVGLEAQLLEATILVDNRRFDEAGAILDRLLDAPPEIAGTAHSLLARILWESGPLDAERLKEIEEHRQQATAWLPETAEAYFLRAMTAVTVKEQLAALDKALQLDPDHYESLRQRAFTYYASRRYERMRDDALGMIYLRRRDPLGHSLRATALRELGKYAEAIAEYDNAMARPSKEEPQYLDLSSQRCETFLRMGDYEHVIAETRACLKLWPDKPVFQHHLFCALTALGDYDQAAALFRQIVAPGQESRLPFENWCSKYVFDTLEVGRSWHPGDREPTGPAFLPMVEAEETYQRLLAKAKRVTTEGFSSRWSPDGSKLAFSLGVHGYSGVAVYDPATKDTDLLIVPGKDPAWSPDGKYIAFVRDRQVLRLEELTMAKGKNQQPPKTDEEVWVMNADGTEPRRLARGGWPSWSRDSTRVYYHSRVDKTLCSISLDGQDAQPKRIMACSSEFPSISADEKYMAYLENASLKVKDLVSQALVAQWDVPFITWSTVAWSPAGRELCLGGGSGSQDTSGLWIYTLGRAEPANVLSGQVRNASWSPKGTELAINLRLSYSEIWTVALDPKVPTIEALGPGRTLQEHCQEIVALCTRRIQADPQDAYAYSNRAHYYDCLHDRPAAIADMRRWSAVVSGRLPLDLQFATLENFRHVINLPFDCELVFSAERPVNEIPVLSVAFGQKGRWEMKLFEMPMVVMSLLGLCLLSGVDTPIAYGDFTFGEPTNLGPVINTSGDDFTGAISRDMLEFYVGTRSTTWVFRRATVDSAWEPGSVFGPLVGSPYMEGAGCLLADGLSLYVSSNRPGGVGTYDLWRRTRTTTEDDWSAPVNLGANVNSPSWDWSSSLSPDELELYFTSNRPGGYGDMDMYVTRRTTKDAPWGPAVNLSPTLNSPAWDESPTIAADGLTLFFCSMRAGGYGSVDVYMARRATTKDPWGSPVNLGPVVNTPYEETNTVLSPDGTILYFTSTRPGGYGGSDVWQVPIILTLDFSGDGKVDAADMAILVANWGKSNSVCDIGPFAWGDGVVDEKDLRVLMESLVTPGPGASDVPRDVILSWVSPSSAQICDVYVGTSFEPVNNADQGDPCGVLVSQGQVATTYDPDGLLEYGRTYYWRVDFVGPGPAFTVYKGPVLEFTTESFAYPIKSITATASSSGAGTSPGKTVDGSGLDNNDGHSITGTDMWLSAGTQPNWIQYQFDKVYTLHELWVWNWNQTAEPYVGFGAKTVRIEYSADGTIWTPLEGVPEFAQAPGQPGYTANTIVSFAGVSAKYVKLTIDKNWSVAPQTGLSEVRFFYIPDRPATQP